MRGITVWLDENKLHNKLVENGFDYADVDSRIFTKYNGECKLHNAEAIANVLNCRLSELLVDEMIEYVCSNCFNRVTNVSKFCPNCGTELGGFTNNGDMFKIIKVEDPICEE